MGAALKGRNEVVQMLIAHGAKLETLDGGSGLTFLAKTIRHRGNGPRIATQSANPGFQEQTACLH